MGVTLHGTFFCSKAAIEQMKPVGRGSILNISSISGSLIGGESVPYHTAKAGLNHLTRNLAYHAGPFGIRVNAIAPGLVIKKENLDRYNSDTEFKSRWEFCHPLRSHGGSEDICNAILFLASDYAKFITGHVLTIDGGLSLREAGTAVHDFHHASMTSAQTSPSPGAS